MAASNRRNPQQSRSRAIVSSIVEATIDLIGREREVPSIRRIARRAGVGVGSVYDYFEGRDAILTAVYERLTRDNFERLLAGWEADAGESTEVAMRNILEAFFDLYLTRAALTRTAIRVIVGLGHLPYVTAERDRFARMVAGRLHAELPRVDALEVERAVIGVADLVMGAIVSELYRAPNATRIGAVKGMSWRLVSAELTRLRELNARA